MVFTFDDERYDWNILCCCGIMFMNTNTEVVGFIRLFFRNIIYNYIQLYLSVRILW